MTNTEVEILAFAYYAQKKTLLKPLYPNIMWYMLYKRLFTDTFSFCYTLWGVNWETVPVTLSNVWDAFFRN